MSPTRKSPRNRVSAKILASSPRFSEETRFLIPAQIIQETGFLRKFWHPHARFSEETRFMIPAQIIQETGFLRKFWYPHPDFVKKPGF